MSCQVLDLLDNQNTHSYAFNSFLKKINNNKK